MKSIVRYYNRLLLGLVILSSITCIDARRCAEFSDIFVPFPEAMEGHPYTKAYDLCDTKTEWQLVKRLYTKYLVDDLDWLDEPRIPKIVHHIWLGSPLPEKCKLLRDTWAVNHPGWKLVLWTDKDVEKFGMENKALFDASNNWGEKSDIWRYEIVYRYGGLYVDTDFESIKPMDVFHHSVDFYAGIYTSHAHAKSPNVVMGMGLIGAVPGHPILRAAIDGLRGVKIEKTNSSAILARTGPYYFTRITLANAGKNNLRDVILPPMFVYPTPITARGQTLEEQHKHFITHSTFANHVWHMSWIGGANKRGKK